MTLIVRSKQELQRYLGEQRRRATDYGNRTDSENHFRPPKRHAPHRDFEKRQEKQA